MKTRLTTPSSRTGFTLVEILVAAALGAVLATMAVQFGVRALETFGQAEGRLASAQQARIALDQIARDLSTAWFRDDGKVWLAADLISNPGAGNLPAHEEEREEVRFGAAGVWLRFIATGPDSASVPSAVGYRIVRGRAAPDLPAGYQLHRFVAPSAGEGESVGTFESGYDLTAAAYAPESLVWRAFDADAREPSTLLANHVVDFGVRGFVFDRAAPDGLRLIFPRHAGATLRVSRSRRTTEPSDGEAEEFPDVLEVFVRVLDPEGVHRLAVLEDGPLPRTGELLPTSWWDIVRAHSRVHFRRIVLRGS